MYNSRMITLILPDPPSSIIKAVEYLASKGDLLSYELSVNAYEYVDAHIVFADYQAFRFVVELLDEVDFFKKES